MNGLDVWVYAVAFLGSLTLTLVMVPVALRFATRRGVLDVPAGHKSHTSPVPYLGGVAIAVAFSLAILVPAALGVAGTQLVDVVVIVGVAVALSLVGLVDDLRGLGVTPRLAVQLGAGVAVWAIGSGVSLFAMEPVNALLTILWVVAVTNAFNLLDNMDGLSAGVAAIASLFFFVIASLEGQFLVAALAIALAGCSLGFLRHNFPPARIYMGDAGSLFIGFLLAVVGVRLRFDAPMQITFFVPILVLGIAIFDTALVVVTRLAHGKNPLSGGRDHTSHRLVFVGIPVHASVSLIYAGAIALGWLAIVMSRVDQMTGFVLMGFVLAAAAFFGVLIGMVPVYENSRRKRLMIQEVIEHEPEAHDPAAAIDRENEVMA